MKATFYVKEDQVENKLLRRLVILVLSLALVLFGVVALLIWRQSEKSATILADFNQAIAEEDYPAAMVAYRKAKELALADQLPAGQQALFQEALSAVEAKTSQLLAEVEEKIRQGKPVSQPEQMLIEGLGELSAARLITLLRELTRDYLHGKVSLQLVQTALTRVGTLENIAQGVHGLAEELSQMTQLRSLVARINSELDQQDYWQAWADCQEWTDLADLGPFTKDQLQQLTRRCQSEMYEPLLAQARQKIAGGRYISANQSLSELAEVFPDDQAIRLALEECRPFVPDQLVAWHGVVEFLTIKPLISDTSLAFDNDSYAAAAFDSMLTVTEFSKILPALYDKGYILIDSDSLYDETSQLQTIMLPPGKKPLVLVLEGLNYYATRRQTGNAWNLALDEGGEVAALLPDNQGGFKLDRSAEAIGILDQFVADQPDFSLDGAKGTISLTGYECVFGFITDQDQIDDRNQALTDNGFAPQAFSQAELDENKKEARQIADRLKETGWIFASSTYGFINANEYDLASIKKDTEKWLNQVGSITGPVSILHYPNGSFINGSDERANYLKEQGFILFGGIGSSAYMYVGDRYIYVDKLSLNGYSLNNSQQFDLDRFFSARDIYDKTGRAGFQR